MIYTKNGDKGMTKNIKNQSLSKDYVLFDLLGGIDEISSNLGLAKFEASGALKDSINLLQLEFLRLNTYIAGGERFDSQSAVLRLEQLIDGFSKKFTMPNEFSISGKTKAGALLDVSRAITRRVERTAVKAEKIFIINKNDISYFNRLSDLLYTLARYSDSLENNEAEKITYKTNDINFDLKAACRLCEMVMEKARQSGILVVCAACDSGGNLMTLSRDDNAYIASLKVAQGKAYTAVSLKMKTEVLSELAGPGGGLYGVQHQDDKIVIFGGGVPLIRNGIIVGGFGVSGGSAEQDTALADYAEKCFKELII